MFDFFPGALFCKNKAFHALKLLMNMFVLNPLRHKSVVILNSSFYSFEGSNSTVLESGIKITYIIVLIPSIVGTHLSMIPCLTWI